MRNIPITELFPLSFLPSRHIGHHTSSFLSTAIFILANLCIILFHFCIDFHYLAFFQPSFTLMPDCVLNDREYPDRINSCHLTFNSIEIKACSSLSRYKEKYKHCDKS